MADLTTETNQQPAPTVYQGQRAQIVPTAHEDSSYESPEDTETEETTEEVVEEQSETTDEITEDMIKAELEKTQPEDQKQDEPEPEEYAKFDAWLENRYGITRTQGEEILKSLEALSTQAAASGMSQVITSFGIPAAEVPLYQQKIVDTWSKLSPEMQQRLDSAEGARIIMQMIVGNNANSTATPTNPQKGKTTGGKSGKPGLTEEKIAKMSPDEYTANIEAIEAFYARQYAQRT